MRKYDWEAIHSDYRTGQHSVRALATKHGVTEGAIRKRARTEGWQRDLSYHVKNATNAKLVRSESTHNDAYLPDDDQALIDSAADSNVALVLEHRQAVARWKTISNRLAGTLESMAIDESSALEFARTLNAGVDALGKVIKLERQAFNLDTKGQDDTQTFEQVMNSVSPLSDDELDERIITLSAQVYGQTP
ncbi:MULTISPECIES: hypothetical protein [unclassified Halomonas]|uniref:hypothetical protein n=1 Tax=unclassified Halomonas TaxID=2609666 RepID=UPI0040343375